MFKLNFKDHRPIYEQIKDNIRELAVKGVLKADQQIPSVRELAQTLTINPNTIQKAYRELEAEGYIYTIRGKGSFIALIDVNTNQLRQVELFEQLVKIVEELSYLSVPEEEIIKNVKNIYEKRREQNRD